MYDWQHTPDGVAGDYEWPENVIHIDVDIFNYPLYAVHVIAHEVGHAMGLNHIPIELGPAIMNPISNESIELTLLDYNQWCNLWCGKHFYNGGNGP
jgi:hypothetical protein